MLGTLSRSTVTGDRDTVLGMTDVKYTEVDASDDDPEGRVLDSLAYGMPYAFVVATSIEPLDLRLAANYDTGTIRALLEQTLKALPPE